MKKIVLGFIVAALGAAPGAKAQTLSLGPVAGIGQNWLGQETHQHFKPSGYLGIGLVYSSNVHWGFTDNLVVSHEGYQTKMNVAGTNYKVTVDPTYLRMTPTVAYFFGQYGNTVRPKLFVGPSIAVKLREDQYTSTDGPLTETNTTTINPSGDVYKAWDFGVMGGAGANIKLASATWLNLDASYYQGIKDVTGNDNVNKGVKFDVGIMFGL